MSSTYYVEWEVAGDLKWSLISDIDSIEWEPSASAVYFWRNIDGKKKRLQAIVRNPISVIRQDEE